jgi:molybdenum cofactor synthesis domain-containing protein
MNLRIAILTVSDRSSSGERKDLSGPILHKFCGEQKWEVIDTATVPDEFNQIKKQLKKWVDKNTADVILTTGGTGFSPRDITPEATKAVIEKEAPGLAEAMRLASAQKNPHAFLSRAVAGIRKQTLIINLPGSPQGALENLKSIYLLLPHAIELLQNCKDAEKHHSRLLQS